MAAPEKPQRSPSIDKREREERDVQILTEERSKILQLKVNVTGSLNHPNWYDPVFIEKLFTGVANTELLDVLKKNQKGSEFSANIALQILLFQLGCNSKDNIDGIYPVNSNSLKYSRTQKAILKFQEKYGLPEKDGVFRNEYIAKLEMEVAALHSHTNGTNPLPQGESQLLAEKVEQALLSRDFEENVVDVQPLPDGFWNIVLRNENGQEFTFKVSLEGNTLFLVYPKNNEVNRQTPWNRPEGGKFAIWRFLTDFAYFNIAKTPSPERVFKKPPEESLYPSANI